MSVALIERLTTAGELAERPDDGVSYELSRGRLICTQPAPYRSGRIGGRVMAVLFHFAEANKLGDCGSAETGFLLARNPDTVRAPDAWFVREARAHALGGVSGFFPGPPDLAIEILSPTDRFQLVAGKIRDYMDAATPLLWVFDPEAKNVAVFRPDHPVRFHDATDTLDGADVLPGFTLSLAGLFT